MMEKKEKKEDPKKKAAREARERAALKKIRKRNRAKEKQKEKFLKGGKVPLAAITNIHDKVQDGIDGAFITVGKQAVSGAHKISSTYTHSRKGIGIAVLITGLLAASILVVFDMFTIYEYSYNGKVLGYVKNQDEVTDVLDVAGRQLGVLGVPVNGGLLVFPAQTLAQLTGHGQVKTVVFAVSTDEAKGRELSVKAYNQGLLVSVGIAAGAHGQAQHSGQNQSKKLFHKRFLRSEVFHG